MTNIANKHPEPFNEAIRLATCISDLATGAPGVEHPYLYAWTRGLGEACLSTAKIVAYGPKQVAEYRRLRAEELALTKPVRLGSVAELKTAKTPAQEEDMRQAA